MPERARARPVTACRACGSAALEPVADFGAMPLANALVAENAPAGAEPAYPLGLLFCADCALLQTTYRLPGAVLFSAEYPYFASYSESHLAHAAGLTRAITNARPLGAGVRVIEIGSNDGYLLRNFVGGSASVLGIDPAPGPAAAARAAGIETIVEAFDAKLASRLRAKGMAADVLIGNNVLAHVEDLADALRGIEILLAPDGIGVLEVPYVVDMVDAGAFDTIYHEHNCYFSVTALARLFGRSGLALRNVERLPVHGGSLRLWLGRTGTANATIAAMLNDEMARGVASAAFYRAIETRAKQIATALKGLLGDLKVSGARIAAYGAAAKGATLANLAGLGPDLIAYVVDRNPAKQGKRMPGSWLPIVAPDRLMRDPPDYVLIFAWNIAPEVMAQLADFKGRFIVPVPEPRIL